jgi:hypothetical protein
MNKFAHILFAVVAGFFALFPLGYIFRKMEWPLFEPWALGHGSFVIAWPILSYIAYRAWSLVLFIRR